MGTGMGTMTWVWVQLQGTGMSPACQESRVYWNETRSVGTGTNFRIRILKFHNYGYG